MRFYINSVEEMRLTATGNLHVDQNIYAYSTTTASDIKLKDNVETIESALSLVEDMRGVTWNWKKDGAKCAGVIAQEIQPIFPVVVKENTDEDKTLSVSYGNMVGILIEAIKEQQKQIEELKNN